MSKATNADSKHLNNNDMNWKVEFYKNESDWRNDIRTVSEFNNFEAAKDFTLMKISNHMGAVRLIHPSTEE